MSGSHAQRLGEDVALGAGAVLVGRIELEPILQGSATRGVEAAAQPAERRLRAKVRYHAAHRDVCGLARHLIRLCIWDVPSSQ
jgi:hypothetical protein